jgi:type I restriction enzyme, S subunit
MSFPKYERYKDSGVEWLGEVPEHWDVTSLKRHANIFPSNVDKKSYEGQYPVFLCNYTDVYYNEEIVEGINFMPATATAEQIEKFSLRAGDTIFTKDSEMANDIAIAAYVPKDLPGIICGYHLSIVRPGATLIGAFIKKLFDTKSAKAYFEVSANGLTRMGLSQYATDHLPAPIPPLIEQQKIVEFLDYETGRIDALIGEQERLIALLKEKRQAVISHAVTKGLDPNAPLKDSGIDWLGQIPAHWEICRAKHITSFITSGPRGWSDHIDESGIDIFIQSGDLDDQLNVLFNSAQRIKTPQGSESNRTRIHNGDVLVCITGAKTGKVAVACLQEEIAYINQHIGLMRPIPRLCLSNYLGYLLSSSFCQSYFFVEQYGLKVSLNLADLAEVPLALPPLAEQFKILEEIQKIIEILDRLTLDVQKMIILLQERRSALISAAVTGKIDLRHWQPPTPNPQ